MIRTKGRFCIAVNGGHHKSTALLFDSETLAVTQAFGQPLNLHALNDDELLTRFSFLLQDLANEAQLPPPSEMIGEIRQIVVSLPGAGLECDNARAYLLISKETGEDVLRVVDDTWAGLFAETREERGICAFAGAGASVCIALDGFKTGKDYKIDGWGPVIGDFGSASHLVTKFLRGLGRRLDKGENSSLFEAVKAFTTNAKSEVFELEGMEHVQTWFDKLHAELGSEWRTMFCRLAIPITAAADREPVPDVEARALVRSCAIHLANSIMITCKHFGQQAESLPIVLQGGMCRHSRYYRESIVERLGRLSERVRFAELKPVHGALLMACPELARLSNADLARVLPSARLAHYSTTLGGPK